MTNDKRSKDLDRDIDENLKRVYRDVLEGDVPERFRDLLDRLKSEDSDGDDGDKTI